MLALAVTVASFALVPFIPTTFVPPGNQNRTTLQLELAPGSNLEDTTAATEQARALLAEHGRPHDDATVVVGTDKKLVTAALKQAEEKKKAPIKAELTDLIKTLDEKSSMFAVALVKDKFANVKFPGGGIHRAESPAQAATREVREEVGLTIEDWTALGVVESRDFANAAHTTGSSAATIMQ